MAIGETFLSAFLQVLFEQLLTTGGIQFLKLIGGVDLPKTIKKWKIQLTRLEALLDDAELQQFHSKPVKLWLNDLQDLAYDIEDILDHFATEALGYQLNKAEEDEVNAVIDYSHHGILNNMVQTIYASSSKAAHSLSTLLKPVEQDIRDKVDDITERLLDIQDQTHSLSLTAAHMMQHQTLQTETLRSQRETTSLVCKVFGRDEKKQEIITLLLKDEQSAENYVVIPIVGTGGIGKTTLAQYVYNDEQLNGCFDTKAWVCISDVFDVKRVTKDIINSATQSYLFDCSNLDQAQVKLQEVLRDKKFLIVLDDIWSEKYDDWYNLQEPFQHGAKGSRVIMTTRNENIARMMINNPALCNIPKLETLSSDDCWLIFQQHAKVEFDLPQMRHNIIEKVNGLPLAAKALGGLLKSIPDKSQRRKILESSVWGEKSSVLPVLRLSYHHMPSYLKRVFSYCSVLPKGYKFMEMEVILLWMAQGFLPETQNERMEDMGHKYFNDLVSRSLYEQIPSDEGKYIMHDLIHDVAQLSAGDVCYLMDAKKDIPKRTRHLYITEHVQTLTDLIMAPQLRTFLCNSYLIVYNLNFIQRMCYIRALLLVSDEIEILPDCVGDLKHLRYLGIEFKRMKMLPQSINNLWNLQTLCLKGCYKLERVPYIGSLSKLRYMYISEFSLKEMPLGIEKLTNMQTLEKFVLATGSGYRVKELERLNQLRERLMVSGLENVTEVADALDAQLHKKKSLDGLYMKWGTYVDEVDDKTNRYVAEKLQPHISIKKCELDGYMGSTFPSWLGDLSFSNMVDIKLNKCQKCECLPPLGQLPTLKSLWIEKMNGIKEVGLEFYGHCSNPFPSLKTLYFYGVKSWEKWVHPPVENNRAFPILEKLSIKHCPSLQGDLPPHLPSLRKLGIIECRRLESLELKNLSSSTCRLEVIYVKGCESIVFIGHIPLTLQPLEIDDCEKLGCVDYDEQAINLSARSDNEKALKSEQPTKVSLELPFLTELRIERCPSLRSLQENLLLPALQNLHLWDCRNMERLPAQLHNFNSLQRFYIKECPKIHCLAEGGLPKSLKYLYIEEVNVKQAVREWGLNLLQSLKVLTLKNVGSSLDSVECIPCPYLSLPSSLSELNIKGFQNLKNISLLSNLTLFMNLSIKDCPKFHNFPQGGLPKNLRSILIWGTNIDKPIKEWGLHILSSLESLILVNVGSSVDTVECITCSDLPSSLELLEIEGFQNLKTLCCSTLPRLFLLHIRSCPKFESFGDDGLPPRISFISIKDCGVIEQQLRSDPNGGIQTVNGKFSLPLSKNQPSSAHPSIPCSGLMSKLG